MYKSIIRNLLKGGNTKYIISISTFSILILPSLTSEARSRPLVFPNNTQQRLFRQSSSGWEEANLRKFAKPNWVNYPRQKKPILRWIKKLDMDGNDYWQHLRTSILVELWNLIYSVQLYIWAKVCRMEKKCSIYVPTKPSLEESPWPNRHSN